MLESKISAGTTYAIISPASVDQKNVNIVTVKELTCHSTIEMTMVYAHLDPQREMKAVKQLDHLYK